MNQRIITSNVSRRDLMAGAAKVAAGGALAAMLAPSGLTSAVAQSTPAAGFAGLGYPELKVTITDTGYEGIPDTLTAGRYLLTATTKTPVPTPSATSDQNPPTVSFISPTPAGMSAADFLQATGGGGTPTAGASPEAGGTPAAGQDQGDEEAPPPLVFYQMKFAGGTMVFPGQTSAQAVIDLTAGEWVAWGDGPGTQWQPVTFTVTGDFPADVKDPEADITVTLIDFAISFEGNLTAGTHTVKVQNHGAEPHFLTMEKGPDTMTKEQVQATLTGEMSGTPAANAISESDLQPAAYTPTQSIGTVTWHEIALEAGTYFAACFFPTAGTGVPHAMNGMIDVVKVTG